ncbi:MAG: phosphate signaling complex protein PhoU [Phycisphaerales bacterium]|nr:phosphate signaling complex protein PhoU [Phycisphaerales bacterium]
MSQHFVHEIERLKKRLLALGALVEESVHRAVLSVQNRDSRLATQVIKSDAEIDRAEVELEEECLKVLALHQPVAHDLRFVVAVLKINNDLERIGDLATNIASRAFYLSNQPPTKMPFDFFAMSGKVEWMLKTTLDAMVKEDKSLAYQVLAADDEVDAINREMYTRVESGIRQSPDELERLIHMLGVSRALERIADHTTNVAEDIIYMQEGQIVRHQTIQPGASGPRVSAGQKAG